MRCWQRSFGPPRREARSWRPGKGFGPRLQPVVHAPDAAVEHLAARAHGEAEAGDDEDVALLAIMQIRDLALYRDGRGRSDSRQPAVKVDDRRSQGRGVREALGQVGRPSAHSPR